MKYSIVSGTSSADLTRARGWVFTRFVEIREEVSRPTNRDKIVITTLPSGGNGFMILRDPAEYIVIKRWEWKDTENEPDITDEKNHYENENQLILNERKQILLEEKRKKTKPPQPQGIPQDLIALVGLVASRNEKISKQINSGNEKAINSIVGLTIKECNGRFDPQIIKSAVYSHFKCVQTL